MHKDVRPTNFDFAGTHFRNTVMVLGLHGPHVWERAANDVMVKEKWNREVVQMEDKVIELSDWVIRYISYFYSKSMSFSPLCLALVTIWWTGMLTKAAEQRLWGDR